MVGNNPLAGELELYRENIALWKIHVTSKSHAYLKTSTKAPATFPKDAGKIVGGVAFIRYPVTICFGRRCVKINLDQTAIKVTKINLKITA